jgi:ABC-type multidrug transport system fused ATPase/permease subunit
LLNKLSKKYPRSTVIRAAKVLSKHDQQKIAAVILIQIFLSLLDLLGVALVGILGTLAVSGIQSDQPGSRVTSALLFLNIDQYSMQRQVAILGLLAASVLIGRTIISAIFIRKTMYFLSRRGAVVSSNLVAKLFNQSTLIVNSRSHQTTLYTVTTGVSSITNGILGATVALISDSSLLIIMSVGLFIVDPLMSVASFILFGAVGYFLYKSMHGRAGILGVTTTQITIQSNEKIIELLSSYREAVVRKRRFFYFKQFSDLRLDLANSEAELNFMPNISKYVFESSMVLGALAICGFQFALQDAAHAVATLAIFMAAGTRIAPAILRMQQGSLQIRNSLGSASATLDLIEEFADSPSISRSIDSIELVHVDFNPSVKVEGVIFRYPEEITDTIKGVSANINPGAFCAFVGPSGAGKTTLADLILGILIPTEGSILISGLVPIEAIDKWPGAISYVPQETYISNGTVRENLALGYPADVAENSNLERVLKLTSLWDFVSELPDGLDTHLGQNGMRLSGGQRQRLGIARALLTNPSILILDEATSSLDGQLEAEITNAIGNLRGQVTLIVIAHRLSTVRDADQILYLDNGNLVCSGTFPEVREKVPDFDAQAKLMGL